MEVTEKCLIYHYFRILHNVHLCDKGPDILISMQLESNACVLWCDNKWVTPRRIRQENEFRKRTRAWRQSYTIHSDWNWRLHLRSFEYSSTSYQIPSTINISVMLSTIMWRVKRFLPDLYVYIHQHFSLMNTLILFLLYIRNGLQMSATMCSDNINLQYILLINTRHALSSLGIISYIMCLFKMQSYQMHSIFKSILTFKWRIKSCLPFAGIIRISPYSPRF